MNKLECVSCGFSPTRDPTVVRVWREFRYKYDASDLYQGVYGLALAIRSDVNGTVYSFNTGVWALDGRLVDSTSPLYSTYFPVLDGGIVTAFRTSWTLSNPDLAPRTDIWAGANVGVDKFPSSSFYGPAELTNLKGMVNVSGMRSGQITSYPATRRFSSLPFASNNATLLPGYQLDTHFIYIPPCYCTIAVAKICNIILRVEMTLEVVLGLQVNMKMHPVKFKTKQQYEKECHPKIVMKLWDQWQLVWQDDNSSLKLKCPKPTAVCNPLNTKDLSGVRLQRR